MSVHRDELDLTDVKEAAEVRAALRSFLRVTEATVRRHALTPQRYLLLLMIKGAPDGSERSTVSELCDRLALAQSTVTELVQRAEDAGLVRRDASEDDGRVAHLFLTAEAEVRFAAAFRDLRQERERLVALLRDVQGGLHAPAS